MQNRNGSSRLQRARTQLKIARSALVAAAVAAFGGIAVAAKASHPATHSSRTNARASVATGDEQSDDSLDYGSASISPSLGGTPSFGSSSS